MAVVTAFLLLCQVINFSGSDKNISKCYLTLSWKTERKQRVRTLLGPCCLCCSPLCPCWYRMEEPREDMRHCRASAANGQWQGLHRKLTLVCDFPTLTAEGLIKFWRNLSVLFYLLEGKGHVNQPWVIHPKPSLSVLKKPSGFISFSPASLHTGMPKNSNPVSSPLPWKRLGVWQRRTNSWS